jgi:hypothetical protein
MCGFRFSVHTAPFAAHDIEPMLGSRPRWRLRSRRRCYRGDRVSGGWHPFPVESHSSYEAWAGVESTIPPASSGLLRPRPFAGFLFALRIRGARNGNYKHGRYTANSMNFFLVIRIGHRLGMLSRRSWVQVTRCDWRLARWPLDRRARYRGAPREMRGNQQISFRSRPARQ